MKQILILALLFSGLLLLGCVESEATPINKTITNATNATSTVAVQPKLEFRIGEAVVINGKEQLIVKSLEETFSYDYVSSYGSGSREATPGKKFVMMNVETKNIGSDEIFINNQFYILTTEGDQYEPTITLLGDAAFPIFKQLLPASRVVGIVAFEVPENLNITKVYYKYSNIFDSEVKTVAWSK